MSSGSGNQLREINVLQSEKTELLVRTQNQEALLRKLEDENARLRSELKLKAAGSKAVSSDAFKSAQVIHELEAKLDALQAVNDSLKEELETVRATVTMDVKDRQQSESRYQKLESTFKDVKDRAGQYERDLKEKDSMIHVQERMINSAAVAREALEARVADLEKRAELYGSLEEIKDAAEAEARRLRKQLELVSVEASHQQHVLQNDLQASRQLLEEIKLEYEQFAQESRVDREQLEKSMSVEYQKLKEEFEQFRLQKHEATEELVQEQHDLVHALQTQFEEYRKTAEHLFEKEAQKVNQRLQAQMTNHQEELRYIVKLKDHEYKEMVTSKDAKIMNLIEGTDVQRVMVQHEMELEQLKRQHARDIETAKQVAQSAQRKYVNELKKQISEHEQESEKLIHKLGGWESKFADARAEIENLQRQLQIQEATHSENLAQVKNQVAAALDANDKLTRAKEQLRHKVLRLRLQLEGQADDSLDSIAQRLARESSLLTTQLQSITARHNAEVKQNMALRKSLNAARAHIEKQDRELKRRAQEMTKVTATLERVLHARVDRTSRATSTAHLSSAVAGTPNGNIKDSSSALVGLFQKRLAAARRHGESDESYEAADGDGDGDGDGNGDGDGDGDGDGVGVGEADRAAEARLRFKPSRKARDLRRAIERTGTASNKDGRMSSLTLGFERLEHFKRMSRQFNDWNSRRKGPGGGGTSAEFLMMKGTFRGRHSGGDDLVGIFHGDGDDDEDDDDSSTVSGGASAIAGIGDGRGGSYFHAGSAGRDKSLTSMVAKRYEADARADAEGDAGAYAAFDDEERAPLYGAVDKRTTARLVQDRFVHDSVANPDQDQQSPYDDNSGGLQVLQFEPRQPSEEARRTSAVGGRANRMSQLAQQRTRLRKSQQRPPLQPHNV